MAALTRLRWHELEVDRAHDEVDDEQQHEGDDDGLVDRVADALRAALGVHALVAGDDRGDQAEDQRLDHALPDVGQLGERGEAGEVGAGRAVLQDHVEDVAAGHADDADQAVEEHRHEHAGQHARDDEALDRVDARAPSSRRAPRGSCGRRGRRRSPIRAAPAISSEVAIGPASRTTARTAAEPVKDWAPNCLISPPTCSAITAPNGMATSAVGMIVTDAMNHACCRNSRSWKGRRNTPRITSSAKANSLPAVPTGASARLAVRLDIRRCPRP